MLSSWLMLLFTSFAHHSCLFLGRDHLISSLIFIFLPLSSSPVRFTMVPTGWTCSFIGALLVYCLLNHCLPLHLGEQHFTLLLFTFLTNLPVTHPLPQLPDSVPACWVSSSRSLSWLWCPHPAGSSLPRLPAATLQGEQGHGMIKFCPSEHLRAF